MKKAKDGLRKSNMEECGGWSLRCQYIFLSNKRTLEQFFFFAREIQMSLYLYPHFYLEILRRSSGKLINPEALE